MKKLGSILVALFAGLLIQNTTAQTVDVKFSKGEGYRTVPYIADGDTIINGTTKGKVFFVNQDSKYTYQLQTGATLQSDTGVVTFAVLGSYDGITYTSLQTVTWKCKNSDTTVIFDSNTTYYSYRYIKSQITGALATTRAKLKNQYLTVSK